MSHTKPFFEKQCGRNNVSQHGKIIPPLCCLNIISTFCLKPTICRHVLVLHVNIDADFHWFSIAWLCMDHFLASSVTQYHTDCFNQNNFVPFAAGMPCSIGWKWIYGFWTNCHHTFMISPVSINLIIQICPANCNCFVVPFHVFENAYRIHVWNQFIQTRCQPQHAGIEKTNDEHLHPWS